MWNGDIKNIDQIVLYLNDELRKGRSQKDIEINDFKVNERVIAKRLISRGYKKIANQYVLIGDKDITRVITDNKPNKIEQFEENKLTIKDQKIMNNLINLAKNYDKLINIIDQYDKNSTKEYYSKYDKEYDGIVIELPIETVKDFRTSIRVNNVVWEQFNKFAEDHKEFTKRDLLSMALIEYIKKK